MKTGWVLGFLGTMAGAPLVAAQETGVEFGMRFGLGVPMGEVEEDTDLEDWQKQQLPLWFDFGYRASANVMVGGYLSYGFASVGTDFDPVCDLNTVDCSARVLRFGGQLQYHFGPGKNVDGWLGFGVGWDKSSLHFDGQPEDIDLSVSGYEWLMLQGGVDLMVADGVYLGPFAGLTFGQYLSVDCDGPAEVCSEIPNNIQDKAFHEWLFFGARLSFGPY